MRILVVTSTFARWPGDREPPFVNDLCRRLAEAHDVLVLAPHCTGAAREERFSGRLRVRRFRYAPDGLESLAYEGGILEKLRQARWRYLLVAPFLVAECAAVVREMRAFRPDVIHAHWLFPQGFIALLARWLSGRRTPVICTSHGSDVFGLRGGLLAAAKKAVVRRATALSVVSAAMKKEVVSLGAQPDRVHVMPMGVDARERFTPGPGPRSDDEILFVGRLVPNKGVDVLLRALARIGGKVRLTIAGSGPSEHGLRGLARELEVETRVTFAGAVEHERLPEYYRRAALLVVPTVGHEGFGLVAAEGLACECPVVASDLAGLREIVEDGVNALLARPGDAADLADKITRLLRDPEIRRALGRRGRAAVLERLDWQSVAHGYGRLLAGVPGMVA